MLDARIASALRKIISSTSFRRTLSVEEQRAQKEQPILERKANCFCDLWTLSVNQSRLLAGSMSVLDGMSHERKISECALASPGVCKRRKCADPESVLFTHPSVTERLPSLVADPFFFFLQEMK